MKDLFQQYNYILSGKCHCDGFETEKYSNGICEFRVRIKKQTFKVRRNGISVTQWIPVSKLEETLKTYTDVAIQA